MSKILGVIGGMGPAATVAFLARVQALTPAEGDADHIRVVMDLNPQVPDRNTRPGEAEVVLGQMTEGLAAAGAEVIAMPCNTAHAQAGGIRAACEARGLGFIDMIAATADAAASGVKRIGVLATPGGERLYTQALAARGVETVLLEGADREVFMGLVYGVKRGDVGETARAWMLRLAQALADAGAHGLIAGCTEVPLLLSAEDAALPLTDSAEVLARACVEACRV
ncbi:aspartate racemase [Brevundimonas vesicularis]|uniref:Aspartate racemase n=1 Tax=Brevundimonas vesicularis TaxID=41276 RepID=A0A7W9FUY4_BREVE|nr:amino acid racemase [Brevundimonas vesicularis]MBB5772052.1 aspartate racemase [Brevundimonas vesicularis]